MTLPDLLRTSAAQLDGEPATLAERRDRIEVLQRLLTAVSWLKAELSRQLPGYVPLMERSEPK